MNCVLFVADRTSTWMRSHFCGTSKTEHSHSCTNSRFETTEFMHANTSHFTHVLHKQTHILHVHNKTMKSTSASICKGTKSPQNVLFQWIRFQEKQITWSSEVSVLDWLINDWCAHVANFITHLEGCLCVCVCVCLYHLQQLEIKSVTFLWTLSSGK